MPRSRKEKIIKTEVVEEENKETEVRKRIWIIISIILFILLLLLLMHYVPLSLRPNTPAIPEFEVTDRNGEWGAQGTIAVFDEKIAPGSHGEYPFIITNLSDYKLHYYFTIEDDYIGDGNWKDFITFRLKMNNGWYTGSDEWVTIDQLGFEDLIFLPTTKQLMTLEWQWAFESGRDEEDTAMGRVSGVYSVSLSLHAEIVEEE